MESLSAWGKVFQTRGKSESADFPPGCQTFLRAHGTFLRCQIRVQLGLETEIGFQQILRMIPHHLTENSKTEENSYISVAWITEFTTDPKLICFPLIFLNIKSHTRNICRLDHIWCLSHHCHKFLEFCINIIKSFRINWKLLPNIF